MATVRKVLGILVVFFIARTIIACDWCDCENDPRIITYSVDDVTVANLNNSGTIAVVSAGPIPKAAFGILVSFETTEQIARCSGNSLFTPLYACSCDGPTVILLDTVKTIKITTLSDLNEDYLAGSDVTALFKENGYEGYHPIEAAEIEFGLRAFLLTPPEVSGDYRFTVTIEFTDGRILTSTTDEVYLE